MMSEWVLKYADARGEIHQQVIEAETAEKLRDKYAQQGFLVYSVKPKTELAGLSQRLGGRKKSKLNQEKFLIFNQQFVTLIKAGLPILKSLDLLAERLTDAKLSKYIKAVRDDVKTGSSLSDAFSKPGVFPAIYVTSVMAGEKSGSLPDVLERFISYQKLAMAVRKKVLLSLLYPSLLITMTAGLIVFLITYVVPNFAQLYNSMSAELPVMTQLLIAVGTTARNYILLGIGILALAVLGFRFWSRAERSQERLDRIKMRTPILGEIWTKYQVAQLSRVMSTLLTGGIPLVQSLETAGQSLGSRLLQKSLESTRKMVKEGQSLSVALNSTGIFPDLSIDMMEVGESTGALPQMLNSVAEFYEDDVQTRMQAALSLIEPAIMIFMGTFVAFVLVALYLPIFSLADTLG